MPLQSILKSTAPLTLSSVADGFVPWLMADLARASFAAGRARTVLICADDSAMRAVADAVTWFAPEVAVMNFPAWDCLPYDRASPSQRSSAARLALLSRLQTKSAKPQLLLTTLNAATQRTLTPFRVRQLTETLTVGKTISRERLIALLQTQGYDRVDTVADTGEYAVRGSLIDLYCAGAETAVRLDFFGDELESIRSFDPNDQRTIERINSVTLLPASEAVLEEATIKRFRARYREQFGAVAINDPLYQAVSEGRRIGGMEHWLPLLEEALVPAFDHFGDALIVRDAGVAAAADGRFDSISDYYNNRTGMVKAEAGSYRPLVPDALYLSPADYATLAETQPFHTITSFDAPESPRTIAFNVAAARDFSPERGRGDNLYNAFADHAAALKRHGQGIVFACYSTGSRERLAALLNDHGLHTPAFVDHWQEAQGQAAQGKTALAVVPLEHGFTTDQLSLVTEQDLLGDRLIRRTKRKKSADAFMQELATLTPGDLVVHAEHGIGRYEGLMQIPVAKAPHDCVCLLYAGGDKLYVPVENLDILTRYGSESEGVALDRLGGVAWQARRAKMKERIREIAGELIATAAARALKPAPIAETDSQYTAFANGFPYQETDDQERAIQDVLDDLAAGKPMDRLICGDVGFGKTEVALRAAFVAAHGGLQVAIICPTTLLARQHYQTFTERFKGTAVRIGRLSRLVPPAEAKSTKEGLAEGQVDIVIGTHALLAKTIAFKNLGLVIVDEEQRFGVVHKERLKALRNDVHILTLTATPIPRTLQMAMSGLRDLSVIQTPPVDRLAVRTYVMPFDPIVLREALLREHYRGGQSYFVVPRILDLPEIETFLRDKVPEIRSVVAHGQMPPSDVEERMSAFYDKKYDVLLSTTIVESGLDIPSANTMIIHRADKFGLAQLYQLRGRVGRSKTRAYAYLTTHERGFLSSTAEKRLKVLSDLDTLGAGFQLASHDLDIRGGGNLLGDEQSGHIREVGFELYQSMLKEAIMDVKAGGMITQSTKDLSPQITIDAPVMIPDDYVPDLDLRMALYRRINEVETVAEIEPFAAELIDRFGPLPLATANLLTLIEIKLNARTAYIAKIDCGPRGALVSFWNDSFPKIEGLLAYVARLQGTAKLRPDSKLVVSRVWADPQARLHGALQLSRGLAKVAL